MNSPPNSNSNRYTASIDLYERDEDPLVRLGDLGPLARYTYECPATLAHDDPADPWKVREHGRSTAHERDDSGIEDYPADWADLLGRLGDDGDHWVWDGRLPGDPQTEEGRALSQLEVWPLDAYEAPEPDDPNATEIEASTIEEAMEEAVEWAREKIENDNPETLDDGLTTWVTVEGHGEADTERLTIYPAEPECAVSDDGEHDWTGEGCGGCDENPGVWSHGGTTISITERCTHCGLRRTEMCLGSQRNPGESDTMTYEEVAS